VQRLKSAAGAAAGSIVSSIFGKSKEEEAAIRLQAAARGMQACRVFAVKLMMRRLMVRST
jgi:hypothetical protein